MFYGDNLDILHDHLADESVDLIYLDPPFNSNRNYNVLFQAMSGEQSASQIEAFEDTWKWDENASFAYHQLTTDSPENVAALIEAIIEQIALGTALPSHRAHTALFRLTVPNVASIHSHEHHVNFIKLRESYLVYPKV